MCHLSYPHLLSCAYSYKYLEVLWLPKRTQLWALVLSPTGCTEGCIYFPQSCRNTHLPHFLDCLLNTTLIPCLLVLSLDTSRTSLRLIQQSTKFGNRHTAHGRYEYSYNLANSHENCPPPPPPPPKKKKKKNRVTDSNRAELRTVLSTGLNL